MEGAHSPSSSRYVPTEQLLPPSKTTRAMTFAGIAALVGAAAWGLIAHFANTEFGYLAWGIGALVGFAAVKGGGHGTVTALGAAALAVLAIGTGKHFAFRAAVDTAADEYVAGIEPQHHAERTRDAEDWVALGAQPSAAQIETYLEEHGFEPVPPHEFAAQEGPALAAFAAAKPSLEQWRDEIRTDFASGASFVTYLQLQPLRHPLDRARHRFGVRAGQQPHDTDAPARPRRGTPPPRGRAAGDGRGAGGRRQRRRVSLTSGCPDRRPT